MKRIISLTLALLLSAFAVGCANAPSPAGRYVVKTLNGKSIEDSFKDSAQVTDSSLDYMLQMMGISSFEEFIVLELKEDGSLTSKSAGKELETGTWKQSGSKVTLTLGEESFDFTLNGSELSGKIKNDDFVFIKK